MNNDKLKLNKADFSMTKKTSEMRAPMVSGIIKSSFDMPASLHRELRVLAAERGVKLNVLFAEAVRDLLSKYGRKS